MRRASFLPGSIKRLFVSKIYQVLGKGKLPDFIIIGVQKGGTTSLHDHLKQHPDIEMSPNYVKLGGGGLINIKEIQFFSSKKKWPSKISWYKSLFNNNGKLQGESTPSYIYNFDAHERMFKTVPKAKLILILRNPITRAYSEFNHVYQTKNRWDLIDYNKSFEENIKNEIKRKFQGKGMIKRGLYIDQVDHLLKYYPRDQLLILISEKMIADPQKVYDQVFDFLGIKKIKIKYVPDVHKLSYKNQMDEDVEKRLYKVFEPYNERLFKFLGYRIPEWENPYDK